MPIRSDGEERRNRILLAAGEEFGKRGFRNATNNAISARSNANAAAISYYFRDKAGLYRETWAYLQERSAEKYADWIAKDSPEPKNARTPLKGVDREVALARLKKLCRSLFDWMHDDSCHDSEILRYELTDPTGLLEGLEADAVVFPLKSEIKKILSALLGVSEDSLSVVLAAQGIVAWFRSQFQADRVDTGMWSPEECFEYMYSSFLKGMDLSDASAQQKTARKAAGQAEEHPELGVTDEVDAFTLKPLSKLDVLLMKKAEHDGKKNAREEEKPAPEPAGPLDDGDEPFMQQELW